ncbi:MAG: CBS domain-containing protein [Thioalkalispiraceae bacterium]|jgi:CBS domain-containing protein
MATVETLLSNKPKAIWCISPASSVYDAIKLMDEKGVGALAVTHNDSLVGILSERDYARKVILKGRSSQDTSVDEIMTRNVLYAVPEQDIEDCMVMMSEHNVRHMPVLRNQILIGMITLGDVVKEIIKEQKIKIKHLEQTISWGESY